MHAIDRYINDIEPRIQSIYVGAPAQEEPSLQEALSAYGWVLLDSWVAWRTLRFLLRETYVDDKVQEKWFQTPSSYTSTQLKAVWLFDNAAIKFIENSTGKGFKDLFDNTIQANRNSCAHFNRKSKVKGSDYNTIWTYFCSLSKVFLFYETSSFLDCVCSHLSNSGYNTFQVSLGDGANFPIQELREHILEYSKCNKFSLYCMDSQDEIFQILFGLDGCFTKVKDQNGRDVVNDSHPKYSFFGNKGFYLDTKLFTDTVITNWRDGGSTEGKSEMEFALAK